MKRIKLLVLLLTAILVGCASAQRMSEADRQNLSTIAINTQIEKPEKMYYLGPNIGWLFGGIGGLIAGEMQKPARNSLQAFAESNDINIEDIVLEESREAFENFGKVSLTDGSNPQSATLNIVITQYGFSIPTGFSTEVVPIVHIKCSLVDVSGKIIWSANDYTAPLGNPVESMALEDLKSNPELIANAWRVATRIILENIVKTL